MKETTVKTMLEIDGLSVSYGERTVLKDLSLQVGQGQVLALIGPNGAGKSSLIKAVSGVVPLKSGTVRIRGASLNGLSERQRARFIAVVPQALSLPGAYTVRQTVLMGRTPYIDWMGRTSRADLDQVETALEQTQTTALADRLVGELSGGEQQRVLLARAVAQDTPVLLLDEPTTHLDLQYQSVLLNLVRELAERRQVSVLMALHDLNLAGLYSDQVVLLVEGQVRAAGHPADVLTEENLTMAYRVPVHVTLHPDYGTPLVLPDGLYVENRKRRPDT